MSDSKEAFEKIERQFTSSNSVDVERSTVLRADWELAKQYMNEQASRQALEGEPVLWWDENDVWDLDECVKKTPTSRHTIPLYTHPASCSENPNSSDHIADIRKFADGSQEEFETSTLKRFPGLDLSLDSDGDYGDLDAQQHWETWQASRQALDGGPVYVLLSCNSDSPEPTFVEIETEEGVSVSVPWHHHDGFDRVGPLYTHPASADGAEVWEKAMMAAIGEDGPESVADAIRRLKAGSVPSVMSERLDVLAQGLENLQRNSGSDAYQWGFVGAVLKDVKSMISDCVPQLEDRLTLGQRKAAQVGKTIGVLVQTPAGSVAAVTDLGRCTWLSQDVTGSGDLVHTCRLSRAMDGTCMSCGSKQEQGE